MVAMLEAVNIHKVYGNGAKAVVVLRGVNLRVEKGSICAVVGPSGAGKSTLLHILGGLDKPDDGTVAFEGEDLYGLSDAAISRVRNSRIGFVFQFYHLLSEFTVLENVLMPALVSHVSRSQRLALKQEALHLLDTVGLRERVAHFPSQLSGGERQRVAIARALINRPGLLLCDEPTGNLDSATGNEIIGLIRKIHSQENMSVVLVTHNEELAGTLAARIYRLQEGLLVEEGPRAKRS